MLGTIILVLYSFGATLTFFAELTDWMNNILFARHAEECDQHDDFEPRWANGVWRSIGVSLVLVVFWPAGSLLYGVDMWQRFRRWHKARADAELKRAMKHEELP